MHEKGGYIRSNRSVGVEQLMLHYKYYDTRLTDIINRNSSRIQPPNSMFAMFQGSLETIYCTGAFLPCMKRRSNASMH